MCFFLKRLHFLGTVLSSQQNKGERYRDFLYTPLPIHITGIFSMGKDDFFWHTTFEVLKKVE